MSRERARRAYVETYGCQMNISDGELMHGILAADGFEMAGSPEDADLVLVNTCAIREHAEQRVIGRVGELNRLKRDRPDVVIGVTGCMAQRLGERLLQQAPYVDLVMGPDGYRRLPQVLRSIRPAWGSTDAPLPVPGDVPAATLAPRTRETGRQLPVLAATETSSPARLAVVDFEVEENYEGLGIERRSRISAWVPVQRGCDHRCTFCIVPYVRGPEKNRDPARVLDEVCGIAESGTTEVVLLGQTVNSYRHGDWDFPRLLRAVARVDGIRRVRFTSPHPGDVTPELVAVMADEPAVCNQLHLPVQSGHDRTLKRMLRRYTVAEYRDRVRMVRDAIPDIALSTDVIVGFPGETDEEYEATIELMDDVRYDDAFLYRYSPREGTPATRLPAAQFVPHEVAQHRLERIIEHHRTIQLAINTSEIGRRVEVLVERAAKSDGDMLGRTATNKVAAFPGDDTLVGSYLDVVLTATTGATFRGVQTGATPQT